MKHIKVILIKDYPVDALPQLCAPHQPLIALARKSLKSQNNQNHFSLQFSKRYIFHIFEVLVA